MARLGHSTAGAALHYQHASQDRDKVIAEALSKLAGRTVTPIRPASEPTSEPGDATGCCLPPPQRPKTEAHSPCSTV